MKIVQFIIALFLGAIALGVWDTRNHILEIKEGLTLFMMQQEIEK